MRSRIHAWVQSVSTVKSGLPSKLWQSSQDERITRPSDHVGPLAGAHLWHGPSAPSTSLWVSRNINHPSQIPAYHPVTSLLSKHLSPFKTKSNSNLACKAVLMLFAGGTCQSFFTSWRLWSLHLKHFTVPICLLSCLSQLQWFQPQPTGEKQISHKRVITSYIQSRCQAAPGVLNLFSSSLAPSKIQALPSSICHLWCQLCSQVNSAL